MYLGEKNMYSLKSWNTYTGMPLREENMLVSNSEQKMGKKKQEG